MVLGAYPGVEGDFHDDNDCGAVATDNVGASGPPSGSWNRKRELARMVSRHRHRRTGVTASDPAITGRQAMAVGTQPAVPSKAERIMTNEQTTYPAPRRDPVTGETLLITRLEGPTTGITIEGRFSFGGSGRLNGLSSEHLAFVEVFLKNRGIIKDVEAELGISYPTVRARLDEVIRALGVSAREAARYMKRATRTEERRARQAGSSIPLGEERAE